jgi:hypothetical protein
MFDFPKWFGWVRERTDQLRSEGLTIDFKIGPSDSPKQGIGIGLTGANAIGLLEIWITGETDFTIMAQQSPDMKMVAYEWGMISTDESFERTFEKFVAEFYKFEVSN